MGEGEAIGAVAGGGAAAGAITPMGWLMAGSTVLSALAGGGSAPAGPSNASAYTEQIFDNSGWTVATGGSKADSEASDGLQLPPWLLMGVAAVLVIGWVRAKK